MTDQPLDFLFNRKARKKIKRAGNLSKTILLVPTGFTGSFDIDDQPIGWHRITECKDGDLPFYINVYRQSFFRKVNAFTQTGTGSELEMSLESLLHAWKTNRFLLLGQQRPQFDSHFGIIQEYLMWQIRERGWDNRPN